MERLFSTIEHLYLYAELDKNQHLKNANEWLHYSTTLFHKILWITVNYTFPLEESKLRLTTFLVANSSHWDDFYFEYHSTHVMYFGDTSYNFMVCQAQLEWANVK